MKLSTTEKKEGNDVDSIKKFMLGICKLTLSLILVCIVFYLVLMMIFENTILSIISTFIGIIMYLWISYIYNPDPDYKNMGESGTWIDNPLTREDNRNRSKFKDLIFLYPGKVIVNSAVEIYNYFIV